MIDNILLYTQEGKVIYSWESKKGSLSFTNKILVPGFFSAIGSVVRTIFQGQLQRIVFKDKTIVLYARETFVALKSKWILISLMVDTIDNNNLIDNLIVQLMDKILKKVDVNDERLTTNSELDEEIYGFIKKKTYSRNNKKILVSSILVLLSVIATVIIYSFIRSFKNGFDSSNVISIISTIIFGFLLILPSSAISGSKKNSAIIGIVFSILASISIYLIINNLLINSNLFGGLGSFAVYFFYCILLGFCFGYMGGYLIDRYYLH